jgi:hypothetical protein
MSKMPIKRNPAVQEVGIRYEAEVQRQKCPDSSFFEVDFEAVGW